MIFPLCRLGIHFHFIIFWVGKRDTLSNNRASGFMHHGGLVRYTGANHRSTFRLSDSFGKLFPLGVAGTPAIDDDIFCVSRGATEQIHDHNSVTGVSFGKRVAGHPDLPYFREAGETSQLGRIHEVIVTKV
jgi:hypothetical protein